MATKLNITVDQGSTFEEVFNIKDSNGVPVDFTTYTGASQMRKHYTSNSYASFTVGLANTGDVTLSMTSNTTANLEPGRYLYDVEVTDQVNATFRILEGIVTVTPNITR